MRELARTSATPVWLGLVLLTVVTLWLGVDHGLGTSAHKAATVIVMIIAFVKVRFIGMYFMELRHAPLLLRFVFQVWCALFCTLVLVYYLAG
jgi:caa(3)-type oxidase subunit IV